MVHDVTLVDGTVGLTIKLTVPGCPLRASFQEQVERVLLPLESVERVDLSFDVMTPDEMKLEFRLQTAAGQTQFGPKTESQKASVDGEDLLTPIVMRAAEAIVTRKGNK